MQILTFVICKKNTCQHFQFHNTLIDISRPRGQSRKEVFDCIVLFCLKTFLENLVTTRGNLAQMHTSV